MKSILLTAILLLFGLPAFAQQTPARKYFNELNALGKFNHYADKYVCFNDGDDVQGFAIISTLEDVRAAMLDTGTPNLTAVEKMPAQAIRARRRK
jgi:hypothetical protein